MRAVEQFRRAAQDPKFKGWSVVGEPVIGEKIPFFGHPVHYQLQVGEETQDYTSLLRDFGWAVAFGVTEGSKVLTLAQWKPGVNRASWELPPGGIGKAPSGLSEEDILARTQAAYLKETGYGGGTWKYLGATYVETGKYRGPSFDDHGLPAHLYLATALVQYQAARNPAPNEIMQTIEVPLNEFEEVLDSGDFNEVSAEVCALRALRELARARV